MLKDLCIEIIQTCPNHCLFCSSCSSMEQDKMIDFEMFKLIIDHFNRLGGIQELSISGGEPFLHPDLFRMIAYSKKHKIKTVLFTSGIKKRIPISQEIIDSLDPYSRKIEMMFASECFSSIEREEMDALKLIGLDKIVFDYQAVQPEIYDCVMGTKNLYPYVLTSMARASVAHLETDVHFIPMRCNVDEFPDLVEMLNIGEIQNLSILNFVPQGRGLEYRDNLMLDDEGMQTFVKQYQEHSLKFHGKVRIGIPLVKNDTHLCTAGFGKLVIRYDGAVLPCPAFKQVDFDVLRSFGIDIHNIYQDFDQITIQNGTRNKPLCKEFYSFKNHLK